MKIVAEMVEERPGREKFRLSHSEIDALTEAAMAGQHAYSNRALGLIMWCDGWSAQQVAAATGQRVNVVGDVIKAWPIAGMAVLVARG